MASAVIVGAMVTIFVSAMFAMTGDTGGFASSFVGAYVMMALAAGIFIGTFVWMVVWYASPGVSTDNRFGSDPI
jgi:hypothetical protein